ncbi:MAG: inositol monophosphatase family protein [Candidatus Puniceispirillaceae bacterium]
MSSRSQARTHSQLDNVALADFLHTLPDISRPIVSEWFRSGHGVEWKPDESPVTIADKTVELALREAIAARFPDDDILGEEHDDRRGSSGYAWVIDPIDGTRAFICGRPVFGTLIGLVRDDVPIAGFIDMPMLDECYVAVGGGATLNRAPIRTSRVTELAKARIATTAPEALRADSLAAFNRLAGVAATSTYGGDCHNYALLAAGHIDLVLEDGLATHDIMGVVEVIRAAGGIVTDKTGAAVSMAGTSSLLAAATPELHAAALEMAG